MDTNRCGALARFRLVGSATPTDASAADGHGVAFNRQTHAFPADVLLASLHPCQQAARHLPCTRPPDFVAFNALLRFFWQPRPVLLRAHPSCWVIHVGRHACCSILHAHPSCWVIHVGRHAGRPRTPGRIHSEDHIISPRFPPPSSMQIARIMRMNALTSPLPKPMKPTRRLSY